MIVQWKDWTEVSLKNHNNNSNNNNDNISNESKKKIIVKIIERKRNEYFRCTGTMFACKYHLH